MVGLELEFPLIVITESFAWLPVILTSGRRVWFKKVYCNRYLHHNTALGLHYVSIFYGAEEYIMMKLKGGV